MAKIKRNGTLSGKVGNVIYSSWKGIPYQRSMPAVIKQPNTGSQLTQRMKFSLIGRFLQPMKALVRIGFRKFTTKMTAHNMAQSLILKNAITGSYPNVFIDYKKVQLSRGNLPNVISPVAVQSSTGKILFVWTSNVSIGYSKTNDRAMLIAYCEELQSCVFTSNGGKRSEEKAILQVPFFRGKTVQTWISFISEDDKEISDSIFTGEVMVT